MDVGVILKCLHKVNELNLLLLQIVMSLLLNLIYVLEIDLHTLPLHVSEHLGKWSPILFVQLPHVLYARVFR